MDENCSFFIPKKKKQQRTKKCEPLTSLSSFNFLVSFLFIYFIYSFCTIILLYRMFRHKNELITTTYQVKYEVAAVVITMSFIKLKKLFNDITGFLTFVLEKHVQHGNFRGKIHFGFCRRYSIRTTFFVQGNFTRQIMRVTVFELLMKTLSCQRLLLKTNSLCLPLGFLFSLAQLQAASLVLSVSLNEDTVCIQ